MTAAATTRDRRLRVAVVVCALAVQSLAPDGAAARQPLRKVLSGALPGQEGRLTDAIKPLGRVIGGQIANQLPSVGTSTSFVYEFDPASDTFTRTNLTYGPLFSERAITVGRNRLNVNLAYSYVHFDSLDGKSLDHLTARAGHATIGGQEGYVGLRRPDLQGLFQKLPPELIFTQAVLDLDLEAQVFSIAATYGLRDDFDVNIDVPIVRTFVRRRITERTLDPRFVERFGIGTEDEQVIDTFSSRGSAVGLGDIRLRGKYMALRHPVHVAGLLEMALPTGSPGAFHGTGHTRLTPSLIASHIFGDWFEPHVQAGIEFDVDDVDKSQVKYAAGVSVRALPNLAFTADFVGRSELAARARVPSAGRLPAIENGEFAESSPPFHGRPMVVDINRNDILDVSIGLKVAVSPRLVVFANAILPLNDDGLRADVVPTFGVEGSF